MPPTGAQLRHAIMRNFGGMQEFNPYLEFKKRLPETISQAEMSLTPESVCFLIHMDHICDRICENRPPCKICTLEIRAFERGHVVLDPNFFLLCHCNPGSFSYIVVEFDSHQRFRSSAVAGNMQPIRAPRYSLVYTAKNLIPIQGRKRARYGTELQYRYVQLGQSHCIFCMGSALQLESTCNPSVGSRP